MRKNIKMLAGTWDCLHGCPRLLSNHKFPQHHESTPHEFLPLTIQIRGYKKHFNGKKLPKTKLNSYHNFSQTLSYFHQFTYQTISNHYQTLTTSSRDQIKHFQSIKTSRTWLELNSKIQLP